MGCCQSYASRMQKEGDRYVFKWDPRRCCCCSKADIVLECPDELIEKGLSEGQFNEWVNIRLNREINAMLPSMCADTTVGLLTCGIWWCNGRFRDNKSMQMICSCQCCCPGSGACDPSPGLEAITQWQKDFNDQVLRELGLGVRTFSNVFYTSDGKNTRRVVESLLVFALNSQEAAVMEGMPHLTGSVGGCCNLEKPDDPIAI
eukprot:Nk52_evm1s230 gene=Nk52_evmTU1s230